MSPMLLSSISTTGALQNESGVAVLQHLRMQHDVLHMAKGDFCKL